VVRTATSARREKTLGVLNMKPHDIFGIIVRALGLWLVSQSVITLAAIFTAPILILTVIVEAVVGAVFLLGADNLVRAAYHGGPLDDIEPPIGQ
jgi:hypothetical protein